MNGLAWKFLAGVCLAIAVAAGWLYYQSERRAALATERELQALLRAEKAEGLLRESRELGQLIQQADARQQALRAAIADSEQHERERVARAELGARLNEVVAASAALRVAMAEAYASTLKWPANNQEAGMPGPASYRKRALQSATVMPDGLLTLQYVDAHGSTRHLLMRAKMNDAGAFQWTCTSPDLTDVQQLVPGCAFKPR